MKIVHAILTTGFAGSERSTAESCNAQCGRHEVFVILRADHRSRRGGASVVDFLDPRVQVVTVPPRWFTRRAIGRVLADLRPDVIHCHLRRSTRLVARLEPPAVTVATLHVTYNGPHFGAMDGLICNARWQFGDIPAEFAGKVLKANNSLVPHRRLAPDEISQLRQELGGDSRTVHVGGVGRMSHSKGWDILIRAFKQAGLADNVRLSLFGTGSAQRRFAALADDARIRLCGYRDNVKESRSEDLGQVDK